MTSYFQSHNTDFTLYAGDSMQVLRELPDGVFRCVFADPPYFLSNGGISVQSGKQVCVDKGNWDKGGTPEYIMQFNRQWLSLCRDKLTPDGTVWVSGTYHNIFAVANCLTELGYKILNVITWQKSDPPPNLSCRYFNFSTEFIIWARRSDKVPHYFDYDAMKTLNGGTQMTDVWRIPAVGQWEKACGKHPTQKPLRLLYRILLASTKIDDLVLDPFAGSSTTGVAANLLGRRYVGIEREQAFLELSMRRRILLEDTSVRNTLLQKMQETNTEAMVIINHARKETLVRMIETGICYLRAGDTKGSLLVQKGFDRAQYILLHTKGENVHIFKLLRTGRFEIWTRETLEEYGFHPEHAAYYVVLRFDNKHSFPMRADVKLFAGRNTYTAKLKPLREVKE